MKILITAKNLKKATGVSNYFRVLKKYFTLDVEYFTVGARRAGENLIYKYLRTLMDFIKFYKKLKKNKYDLIHLNPSLNKKAVLREMFFARLSIKFDIPFVVFFRGWSKDYEASLEENPPKLKKILNTFSKATKIIVLSEEFKEKLTEWGFKETKIILETTVVEDKIFKYYKINNTENHKPEFNTLFLSRIERDKGIYETLKAHKRLKQKFSFVKLLIAGDGPDLNEVKEYVKNENIEGVYFLGWVSGKEKVKVFRKSDVYLLPTTHGEGMPNAVLEAMALGLPVITRKVGGLKDFFEHKKMGFITAETSPEVFSGFVEILIKNTELKQKISKYNHNYAEKRFKASRVVKRLENIYREAVK